MQACYVGGHRAQLSDPVLANGKMTRLRYCKPQPSDYLAQWNLRRLIAFFKYCDCAALATNGIGKMDWSNPVERLAARMMYSMRTKAVGSALDLFNPFISSFPRSWPKR
jgi:hypothetical protein